MAVRLLGGSDDAALEKASFQTSLILLGSQRFLATLFFNRCAFSASFFARLSKTVDSPNLTFFSNFSFLPSPKILVFLTLIGPFNGGFNSLGAGWVVK